MTNETKRTRVSVIFLCFRNDSDLVLEAQRAAIRAFSNCDTLEPTFVLQDDAWCPTFKDARDRFLAAHPNTRHELTYYRRGNMILGGECILGQCEAFERIARATDADIIMKVDADSCLFSVDWVEEFAEDERALCAGAFDFANNNHTSVFGLCYAIKAKVLNPLVNDLRAYPAHHKAWEDHEVSSRIFRLANGDMRSLMRWRANAKGDNFWVIPLAQANDSFINARAVNCAWDYNITPAKDKESHRMKVCAQMQRWNDLIEAKDNEKALQFINSNKMEILKGIAPLIKGDANQVDADRQLTPAAVDKGE